MENGWDTYISQLLVKFEKHDVINGFGEGSSISLVEVN
jgi:hypothetical protein